MIFVVAALVFGAVMAATCALVLLVSNSASELEVALAPYGSQEGLARTGIVRQLVKAAEGAARRHGLLKWLERRLEQADVKLRAAEVLFFSGAAMVLSTTAAAVVLPFAALPIVVIVTASLPLAALLLAGRRRRRRFAALLPDTLTLLSGTLRSGYSLHQGLDAVSEEVPEPMASETRRALVEARLGRQLDDALADCAERMDSGDLAWAVLALRIQREVGGNLAELLDTVADTMVQRERLRRDVSALTAEGRMSAIVLGVLPPGLGLLLTVLNPDYVGRLFEDVVGQAMLGASAIVAVLGFFWMKKIVDIEI